jgi:hypothetical protein
LGINVTGYQSEFAVPLKMPWHGAFTRLPAVHGEPGQEHAVIYQALRACDAEPVQTSISMWLNSLPEESARREACADRQRRGLRWVEDLRAPRVRYSGWKAT